VRQRHEETGTRHLLPMIGVFALACAVAPASWAQPVAAHSMASMQQRSAALARSYLQIWSSNARAALGQVPQLYAPRVRFYGRVLDHKKLLREKAAFLRRWPVRRYAHRPGTIQVSCDAGSRRCLVRSVIDGHAESPARRVVSRGASRFEQGIDLSGSRPAVFSWRAEPCSRVLAGRGASRIT
jgi:hypothetical protein